MHRVQAARRCARERHFSATTSTSSSSPGSASPWGYATPESAGLRVLVLGCLGLIPPVRRQRPPPPRRHPAAPPLGNTPLPAAARGEPVALVAAMLSANRRGSAWRNGALSPWPASPRTHPKRTPAAIIRSIPGFFCGSLSISRNSRACHPNTIIRPTLR